MNDRERLIEWISETLLWEDVTIDNVCKQVADHLIANGVTVQKHGRWEFADDYTGRCANCHEENIMDWEYEDKFCPNCGAKMMEVNEE